MSQTWRFQPDVQREVDAALAVLDGYAKPTIAFHGKHFLLPLDFCIEATSRAATLALYARTAQNPLSVKHVQV